MLDRRTQILLDEARYERLRRRAEESGSSVSALIREAIDRMLEDDAQRRRQAAAALLDADPVPVPDWPELEREIETMYERSVGDLE